MNDKIISGKITKIETIVSQKSDIDNYSVNIKTTISLNNDQEYNIKNLASGLKVGDNVSLIKENEVKLDLLSPSKSINYLIINSKTPNLLERKKRDSIMFAVANGIFSCSALVIYLMKLFSKENLAYLEYAKVNSLYPFLFILLIVSFLSIPSILFFFSIPSKKIIKQVDNIIKEEELLKLIKEKDPEKVT